MSTPMTYQLTPMTYQLTPMTYQLTSGDSILRLTDNAFIPQAPGNRDYAEYLEWLEAGNEPLPAPEPPAPGPDYLAFWDALTTSSVYGSIREQSFVSLPMNTLATEFIALLTDAKAGRPNETAIQQSISAILETGTFTEEHLIELQEALEAGHLENIYTITQ
jgi:hypothetical protein